MAMKKQTFLKSLAVALQGIAQFFARERNAQLHLVAALLVIVLSIALKISEIEWLFIALSISIVLITEIINTSLEKICDLISKDFHPDIKFIKDISAGAVLIAAIFSVVTACIIFIPRFL